MNPTQLLAQFDRVSAAPDAIPRLRRFILDFAVRGKLVEQDPRDEPASELLKRIQAERERHSSVGPVRKNRANSQVDVDETPFEPPKSWICSSLGEVARYGLPEKVDSNKEISANTWVLDLEDIEKDSSRLIERVRSSSRPFHSSKTRFKKMDVLFGKLRPYLNKVLVADADGVCTTEIVPVRGFCGMAPEYIRLVLKSPLTMKRVDRLMYGMKMPRLGTDDALALNFPLPPLAEQHRIVAKVDELMALCDRLEASQAEQENRRDRLAAASLNRLNNGADADAFRDHARFYFNRLTRLTTRSEHIQQLHQTILNLAVRGKLVPQDPKDEPASELLERIAAQKTKAGSAKTGRDWVGDIATPVDEAFVIPKGWAWTRIANTVERVTVGYVGPMKDQYVEDGIPFLRSQNVRANRFREDGLISISQKFHQTILKSALAPGDVVVVRSGNVGTACVIPPSLLKANCSDLVVVKHPIAVHPTYLCFYLNSLASAHIEAGTVGVALTHFNTKSVATMPLPLPPLAEQQRIVAKVDELMALCDRLEAQLATAQTESRRLLEAVLNEALIPALEKFA
jgi:type I restriction enzyme S subunit